MNKPALFRKSWGRSSILTCVVGLFFSILAGTTFATEQNLQQASTNYNDTEVPQGTEAQQQRTQERDHRLYRVSLLRDRKVKNIDSEQLGRISELVIDKSGQTRYAVLSHGGTLGINEKMTAVPWKALQISTKGEHYILNLSKEQLDEIPTFSEDNWPIQPMWDMGNSAALPTERPKRRQSREDKELE